MGKVNRSVVAVAAFMMALALSTPLRAADEPNPDTLGTPEPEEPQGPNRGRVHLSIASDITNAYFFRGILQEREGFIWQPSADVSINLYSGEGFIRSVDAAFGMWASFQTEKTFASGNGPTNLYEVDYYPYITLGMPGGFSTSVTYLLYTSPNGAFSTLQQVDWGLALDDSEYLGDFALNPAATFSFEVQNTSFGNKEGGYFELGLEPSHDFGDDVVPVTLSVPLAVGLSMYDYYESPAKDPTFGFFSFGLNMGVPLWFIPEEFGSWSTAFGIVIPVLSRTLEEVNKGDIMYPVGTLNLSMSY